MEKFFHPSHPARIISTVTSECGKSSFLTDLILKMVKYFGKNYLYAPSIHQNIYLKQNKCFSKYSPIESNKIQYNPI